MYNQFTIIIKITLYFYYILPSLLSNEYCLLWTDVNCWCYHNQLYSSKNLTAIVKKQE